jgi:hypothetical protein
MNTTTVSHHPAPFAAAAAVVAAFAAITVGSVVASHDSTTSQVPTHPTVTQHYRHFSTTSGGKVMTGF